MAANVVPDLKISKMEQVDANAHPKLTTSGTGQVDADVRLNSKTLKVERVDANVRLNLKIPETDQVDADIRPNLKISTLEHVDANVHPNLNTSGTEQIDANVHPEPKTFEVEHVDANVRLNLKTSGTDQVDADIRPNLKTKQVDANVHPNLKTYGAAQVDATDENDHETSEDADEDRPRKVLPDKVLSWVSKPHGSSGTEPTDATNEDVYEGSQKSDECQLRKVLPDEALSWVSNPRSSSEEPTCSGRPLPNNHPLKVHLEVVLEDRERRKRHWASLIEKFGADFHCPASGLRSLWLKEEKSADEAIADTRRQIKLLEVSLQMTMTESTRAKNPTKGPAPGLGSGEVDTSRPKHGRTQSSPPYRGRSPRRRASFDRPREMRDVLRGVRDSRVKRRGDRRSSMVGSPSKEPTTWSIERRYNAVKAWLGDTGMPTEISPQVGGMQALTSDGSSAPPTESPGTSACRNLPQEVEIFKFEEMSMHPWGDEDLYAGGEHDIPNDHPAGFGASTNK